MIFISEDKELSFNNMVCLYFYASWMPMHKKMISMLNKMELKFEEIHFFAIDVDYFTSLSKRFKITSVPTIIFLKDNIELKKINGILLTSALKHAFNDILNSEDKTTIPVVEPKKQKENL